jgi:PAS domain S-box-containing protein
MSFDSEERILFVNRAAAKMWQLPAEQIIGKTLSDVVGEKTQRALHKYTLQVLTGEIVSYESPFKAPDGSIHTFFNTYTPDRGADGTIRGFVMAGTDVTERKQVKHKAS